MLFPKFGSPNQLIDKWHCLNIDFWNIEAIQASPKTVITKLCPVASGTLPNLGDTTSEVCMQRQQGRNMHVCVPRRISTSIISFQQSGENLNFSVSSARHIFQHTQVTSNKMVHKKRHHFLAQFSITYVICFVGRVSSSKKRLLTQWNSLTANQKLLFNGFWS